MIDRLEVGRRSLLGADNKPGQLTTSRQVRSASAAAFRPRSSIQSVLETNNIKNKKIEQLTVGRAETNSRVTLKSKVQPKNVLRSSRPRSAGLVSQSQRSARSTERVRPVLGRVASQPSLAELQPQHSSLQHQVSHLSQHNRLVADI